MSRFRLYGSGGRPVYDSAGEPAERRLEQIKREFNAGVALFYDPDAGLVRAQVKIHRHSPEQFVATYQTDGEEDLLSSVTDRVRRLAERRGWTIQHGIGGNQALYDTIDDGSAFDPESVAAVERELSAGSIAPETIREAVTERGAVDLYVPNYEAAAATLAYVREAFEGYAVAVTESTDVDTIAGADVFVRPSRDVDRVAPGPEFAAWLDSRQTETALDAFERAVDAALSRDEDGSSPTAPDALADALDRSAPVSDLGLRIVPSDEPSAGRRERRRTLRYGLPGALLAAAVAGAFWIGVVPDSAAALTRGQLSIGALVVGALWLGSVFAIRVRRDVRAGPPRTERGPQSRFEADDDIGRALDALGRLADVADEEAVSEALTDALGPHGVEVCRESERRRQRYRGVIVGVAASAGAAVLVFAVAVLAASVLG
ncbi:hypothetical protein [Halobellus sp. GM3]|uniref:hypothetical protein n=1 Tax=Halobellus sp. GM3 TaxID=3458410 RepID=UPI00403E0A4A